MLGIISVKNSEMIDIEEAMSDYLLYKGKLAPHTHHLHPSPIILLYYFLKFWILNGECISFVTQSSPGSAS